MNKKTLVILLIIVLAAGVIYFIKRNEESTQLPVVTITPISKEGENCGGNIVNAPKCDTGLHCAPKEGSSLPVGDVGGICVKN